MATSAYEEWLLQVPESMIGTIVAATSSIPIHYRTLLAKPRVIALPEAARR